MEQRSQLLRPTSKFRLVRLAFVLKMAVAVTAVHLFQLKCFYEQIRCVTGLQASRPSKSAHG